ncbi:MAG: hypothetical protein HW390_1433 [Candidatus Brocadiaceae bacterium]|nr:hypothetical protein [Candidatus Brocadiaceae bacterium]
MTTINPYNFVPLKSKEPDRSLGYTGKLRLKDDHYSGKIACILKALSPLITLDQSRKDVKNKKFLRNNRKTPILQGASIKGMIRSVYEAITDSCLTFAATNGTSGKDKIPYRYADLGNYLNSKCNSLEALCPACRLFGAIKGDTLNCQGKVAFSDAALVEGTLSQQKCCLKELLSPKPHHYATYGKCGHPGSPVAGRKFYYHQGKTPSFSVKETPSNNRSIIIEEYAPVESAFSFQIYGENLTKEELGKLLLAIELLDGLGHKIGLGKAIGLGSCCITISREKSSITKACKRYENWNTGAIGDWYSLKAGREELSEGLIEVLRLNKAEDGTIRYPDYREYKKEPFNAPINALGVFVGTTLNGGRPPGTDDVAESQPQEPLFKTKQGENAARPDEVAVAPPQEPPPKTKQGEDAAWLKEIYKDKLVFMDTQGKEVVRSRKGYQGKPGLLEAGKWFILSGTNSSRRA